MDLRSLLYEIELLSSECPGVHSAAGALGAARSAIVLWETYPQKYSEADTAEYLAALKQKLLICRTTGKYPASGTPAGQRLAAASAKLYGG